MTTEDAECQDVLAFNIKFSQLTSTVPTHLTRRKLADRANFMLEELKEFGQAAGLTLVAELDDGGKAYFVVDEYGSQDLDLQADALIDLTYVAKGTGVMMGLPWKVLWDDVQRANMAKELGTTHRGYLMDVRKPKGWKGPQTSQILRDAGYRLEDFTTKRPGLITEVTVVDDDKCLDDACHRRA